MWSKLSKYSDIGLLLIRLMLGTSFVIHGVGKFMGGTPVLSGVGSVVSNLGITHGHYFFGILAATSELCGGLLLLTGAFFRPACLLLLWIMIMAMTMHLSHHDGFNVYSHALELGVIFVGLFFIGPGKLSVDRQ